MLTSRDTRGLEHIANVQGEAAATRIDGALRAISPSYTEYSVSSTYGEVGDRTGLELGHRQLVTITVLATLGGCEEQLRLAHLRRAASRVDGRLDG